MPKLRVGVIYGGRSSIMQHLDPDRFEVVPIYISKDGHWRLNGAFPSTLSAAEAVDLAATVGTASHEAHPDETLLRIDRGFAPHAAAVSGLDLDVIFPALHGPYGEDGTVQGLLELTNVAYVGAGVLGSAVSMDKAVMKTLFAAAGLLQAPYTVVPAAEWRSDAEGIGRRVAALGYPVFVKPANLGSSVGVSKVQTPTALAGAMEEALAYDRKAVVEGAVQDAREIECAVLGNTDPAASVPGEIVTSRGFYDYEAKYLDDSVELRIPAPLDEALTAEVQRLALAAFRAVEACGMARVDFLLPRGGNAVVVSEVNTIPGFTSVSMYPKLWEASGLSYPALLSRLIDLAIARHDEKQQLRTSRNVIAANARQL